MSGWRFFRIFITEIFNQGILRRGFFNGTIGIMDSLLQAFSMYMTYVRVWELLSVDVFVDSHLEEIGVEKIIEKIQKLHDLDLSRVNFIKAPIGKGSSFLNRLLYLRKYDVLFFLTDGSYFYSTAKKSIIHLQSPIKNLNQHWWAKFKLSSWDEIIYNSKFTMDEAMKSWGLMGKVIYPPVDVSKFKPLKKKHQILSVGRFFGYLRDKKHELIIDAFKKLVNENNLKNWSLYLVGGSGEGDKEYLDELNKKANGLNIFLHPNLPFNELKKLYGESKIYWHATGFGETDPTKMEHFGITTVEAMASGAIPVVINLGGQREIVENGKLGYLWNSPEELIFYTMELIGSKKLMEDFSKEAVKKSKIYSKEQFSKEIKEIVNGN
ncbi:MAG: Uncharacterized protein G01um101493_413 [Microgenomates group bacterium Gr01-1014_93]|nr:MAG: Uncharacterized protein G01um101493_413 [Microgenomates group bacterium Gr01-1014_93]